MINGELGLSIRRSLKFCTSIIIVMIALQSFCIVLKVHKLYFYGQYLLYIIILFYKYSYLYIFKNIKILTNNFQYKKKFNFVKF